MPIVADTDLDAVLATLEAERPEVCVVDSVQVLYDPALTGAPGSVSQVREVAGRLMRAAKERGIATLLVGHVTKEGSLAGPRVLEHLVDCVLSFEGERERTYRTLRALKNRFGSTNEVGVFEMHEQGLVEVEDASARFVNEATRAPGSVVLCAMEGSRPLLVEVQALVAPSELVPPRRIANGVDRNRLALVLAVLARHGGISFGSADVFVSVAGGVRVDEPGADLAIALALASAAKGVAPASDKPLAAFGELGLTGELRHVGHADRRHRRGAQVRPRSGGHARPGQIDDARHALEGTRVEDSSRNGLAGRLNRLQSTEHCRETGTIPVELAQCRTPETMLQSSRRGRNRGSFEPWRWSPRAPLCARASTTSSRAEPAP